MSVITDNSFKSLVYRGYIERFKEDRLFDIDSNIPMTIVKFYLESNPAAKVSEKIYKNFKMKYILSENELEGVPVSKSEVKCLVLNNPTDHTKEEVIGLGDVYEYINHYTFENSINFTIYELLKIHSILFSHTPFPEYAGRYRNSAARILGSRVDLVDYTDIPMSMMRASYHFNEIIHKKNDLDEYIRSAIRLHATLIKIHPFPDGNGRSTRALLNLLMKYIGLPPTYVKLEEKDKYCEALDDAIIDNNTKKLEQFFLFKLANAIIENDEEFSSEAIKIL